MRRSCYLVVAAACALAACTFASEEEAFAAARDEAMGEMWSLTDGGKPLLTLPRAAAPPMWKVRMVSCVPGSPID